jgi:hypothetical protein
MTKKPPALCMFCDSVPCTCDPVKPRKARKSKPGQRERSAPPAAQTEVEVPSVAGGVDSVFADEQLNKTRFKTDEVERDLSLESALRVILLADILCVEDRNKVLAELTPQPGQDLDRRLSEWKARNVMVD